MASDALRAYAQARESSFFKLEQEADLHRHRSRMISEGRLEEVAGANLRPRRHHTFEESVHVFEVLPEVLQQQARVDDPHAASRKEIVRRIRAELPKLTEEEMQRYRSTVYGVAGVMSTGLPRVSMGRDRYWTAYQAAMASPGKVPELPPAAREMAQRTITAGARSLAYGAALGIAGTALLVAAGVQYAGISSSSDLRDKVRHTLDPVAGALQAGMLPLKERLQMAFDSLGMEPSVSEGPRAGQPETPFTRSIADKYRR